MTGAENFKQEAFSFSGESHFRLFQTSEKQEMLHCHNCLEMNLVESGTGKYIIGGKLYPICQGDMFIINNSERHLAIHEGERLTLSVIVFDSDYVWKKYGQDYLLPFFQRRDNFSNRIYRGCEGYEEMHRAFCFMKEEERRKRAGWQMVMEASANLLLALLYRHYNENQELDEEQRSMQHSFGRINRALAYMDTHFQERITLEQLARETALSRTYLCKCFRDITGQALFEYLEQVRVQHACYLLQTSEKPVAQVGMEAGFETVSYFNRVFKRSCGCTPGQYRRGAAGRL